MNLLNSATVVHQSFCREVGGVSILSRIKTSNVMFFPGYGYSSTPLLKTWTNSPEFRFGVQSNLFSVLKICLLGNVPYVFYPVVGFYPIDVVNDAGRMDAINPQPSHPVGIFFSATNDHSDVPIAIRLCDFFSERIAMNAMKPCKYSGGGVVLKQTHQSRLGKRRICFSHAVVPYKQWIGKKPRRVTSTSGLRHFNASKRVCIGTGNTVQKAKELP